MRRPDFFFAMRSSMVTVLAILPRASSTIDHSPPRAVSHGCVRLSHGDELAEYLLRNDADWPHDRIRASMDGGRETTLALKEPRPVMIVYFTAWVDGEGLVHFRPDVYGHDATLANELFAQPIGATRVEQPRD